MKIHIGSIVLEGTPNELVEFQRLSDLLDADAGRKTTVVNTPQVKVSNDSVQALTSELMGVLKSLTGNKKVSVEG
ncbi:hypothetical protein M5X00_14760 [Paenibacillus alvei]|uniref:hypothetical protein n=1 Tax=Paenibacillus alvei TaxID=44250 RepID=UPI0002889F5C|nr:hypothetical protein [Paenibacillus alvei]EJW20036.1 hypothetical protein PAV_1c10310 [Paenibacillus alvei DSM 29]MCY9543377.1 hypothetical protein [Paenibacillus alvei]MCY9704743.1 hypothetical protein [Paenibacillus alvei]MCY9733704.1 hypothetical protein [Paenibacillus alvei]MCY9755505.1 hypothetical protein [Paenibacillus alvei]